MNTLTKINDLLFIVIPVVMTGLIVMRFINW